MLLSGNTDETAFSTGGGGDPTTIKVNYYSRGSSKEGHMRIEIATGRNHILSNSPKEDMTPSIPSLQQVNTLI